MNYRYRKRLSVGLNNISLTPSIKHMPRERKKRSWLFGVMMIAILFTFVAFFFKLVNMLTAQGG